MKNEIVIQFSGGIDSLFAAHYLAPRYDKIHLVTFDKGYLHLALKSNRTNVEILKRIHGEDKYVHSLIDIRALFKALGVKSYKETKNAFGNEIAWCVPCRASMSLGTIIYALEHDIPSFTDGANWEQTPDGTKVLATADNFPEYLAAIKDIAREYRVGYLPVLYELNTRRERRDALLALGAKIDFNSMDRKKKTLFDVFNKNFYKRYQPMCLSGYFVHWKRNVFNVKEPVTGEMTAKSIRPKLETVGRQFIRDYFLEKGRSIEEIVSARVVSS
jgi:hypothetical protein